MLHEELKGREGRLEAEPREYSHVNKVNSGECQDLPDGGARTVIWGESRVGPTRTMDMGREGVRGGRQEGGGGKGLGGLARPYDEK